jgi:hypothetical protein
MRYVRVASLISICVSLAKSFTISSLISLTSYSTLIALTSEVNDGKFILYISLFYSFYTNKKMGRDYINLPPKFKKLNDYANKLCCLEAVLSRPFSLASPATSMI